MAYRRLEFRGRDAGGVQVWTTAFKFRRANVWSLGLKVWT